MASTRPSIAELRTVCQPASLVGRRNEEHWAGRLYMRDLSLHVTRRLIDAPISPNGLTVVMIVLGLVGAVVVTVPGVLTAVATALLVQLYLLFDCVDGEVARWRRQTSAAGVFLDRVGHHVVEAGLLIGLGVRADGGLTQLGGWTTVGAVTAVLALLAKSQTDLVILARASAGLPLRTTGEEQPRPPVLRGLRRAVAFVPVHRLLGAVELSLVIVLVAALEALVPAVAWTQLLVAGAAGVALLVAVGHPVSILASDRLR